MISYRDGSQQMTTEFDYFGGHHIHNFGALSPDQCGTGWNMFPSEGTAGAIVVISPNDIWAVGGPMRHWDGSQWSVVPSPEPGSSEESWTLTAASAVSSNDVWAVGYTYRRFSYYYNYRTLAMHWNGMEWRVIPTPNLGNIGSRHMLHGVTAIASDDVWAVGLGQFSGPTSTLILHWDGTEWAVVPSPNARSDGENILFGVAHVSADDIWAVGTWHTREVGTKSQTLIQHWDGSEWSIVPSPSISGTDSALSAISVISEDDIWAVGAPRSYPGPANGTTLAVHWDGVEWSIVPSPNPGITANFLDGVDAVSSDDVWAVGSYINPGIGEQHKTLIIHWDGNNWEVVPSPNNSTGYTMLFDVAAVSARDVWAVGNVVQRYTVQFSDVMPDDSFYPNVTCLACRGIISGYEDGTFKPNNQVIRGQLAKIVSNAAGFNEDPGPQIFQDVPPSHAFYQWINRLTIRGHMSGYACGGPGEPCVNNMPYFRPFANATRAQTSKIVSNAAGYSDPPAGQTFQDVPPTHPFYEGIQRLASRGTMGGYECGGAGEPCVPPGNRPYFRPNNNVTRGQSAKIVSNTFYASCQTP
jgi:hypothetical protein